MEKKYLVYKITNKKNKHIYIGVHATTNENDGYMGSGTNIKKEIKKSGVENFDKVIIHRFDNQEDALNKERELVNREFIARKDTYNISLGGGFLTVDSVLVKDKNGECFRVHKNDPRYLKGELKHPSTDKVTVRSKDGKTFSTNKSDPRYLNGEVKPIISGKILVKDKNDKVSWISIGDERYLNGELVGYTKGMVVVKDKKGNTSMVSTTDPRYLSGELIFVQMNSKHTEESKIKIGEANSKHQKGKGNSQYGTMWIYNENLKKNKRIKKNSKIPKGWKKGRKMKY